MKIEKENEIKYELNSIKFDFYTSSDIEKISMKPLTTPQVYNNLGLPEIGGLSDPCMGVQAFDKNSNCEICNQSCENCTGHFSHINLYAPLYNPFMLNHILKLLNIQCFNCHLLKINKKDIAYLFFKLFLIKFDLWKEASELHLLMYESFGENTDDINRKIIKFINDNLTLDLNYFKDLNYDNSNNNFSKDDSFDNDNNDDEKKSKKKKNKNKEKNDNENLEEMKKTIKKNKKKILKELFINIFNKQEKILEKKPKIIYEQSVTNLTLLKEFEKEFWLMTKINKCSNCGATSKRYKKFNNIKIFQINVSEKERKKMEKSGIDVDKNALEHGIGERTKKKNKKIKEILIKESEDPINEFKENKNNKKSNLYDDSLEENIYNENNINDSSDNENEENEIKTDITNSKQKFLPVLEVKELLNKLFQKDSGLLKLLYGNLSYEEISEFKIKIISNAPNYFFIENLIIPPNRFRPEDSSLGNDSHYLHQQTSQYVKIISLNNDIRELSLKVEESKDDKNINKKTTYFEDLISKWTQMQLMINILFDSSKAISKKDQEIKGIKQMIEKKQGIIRMKIMGKRVNHAGRTVISPDPLIKTDEVGVPLFIAGKLYYPEKVTKYNIDYLKQLIINGPYKYPGANQVTLYNNNNHNNNNNSNNTNIISLNYVKDEYRNVISEKIKLGDIVNRHMHNGDILLLNRQPTLHRPSIMSHKAKILPIEKTFRMHYSNCSSYNADFDGDEMNIHFLQDEISREEGYSISNSNNQYIVPTNGKPIRGLLQDSIDSCVYLTMKDTFFTREQYFQLIYSSLEKSLNTKKIRKIVLSQPTIIKPRILYTGKQIITTIINSLATSELIDNIKNAKCTFEHNNKLGSDIWGKGNEEEGKIRLIENELLTGVLDKNEIGASDYGLFHSFYEIFGAELTGEFITIIGKVCVHFLQQFYGFTCSVSDIVLTQKMDFQRRVDIEKILIEGMNSLGKLFDVPDFNLDFDNYSHRSVYSTTKDKNKEIINQMTLEPENKKEINQIIKLQELKITSSLFTSYSQKSPLETLNSSYEKIQQLRNKYELLILKDSLLDINVDTVVKNSLNKSTSSYIKTWLSNGLSSPFPRNNFSMMVKSGSKGSLVNQTLVSCLLGQQELEGRRAPRMSSGKTLPSFQAFDPNPRSSGYITDRFSTGVRPQEFFFHAMAGREGLIDTAVKTSRSGYLQRCLMKHLEQIIVGYDYTVRDCDGNVIQFLYGEDSIDTINTKFLKNFKFICDNFDTYVMKMSPERIVNAIDTKEVKNYIKNNLKGNNNEINNNKETLLNKFEPWKYLGSISEKVYESMHEYIIKDPDNNFKKDNKKISRSEFKNIIYLKYLNSLIQPGESVGVLAAQSIGEPSTQMTLNTFHLAGNGGVNVTLGIPRLREILMTSEKNIKTPIMTLPLLSNNIEDAKKLGRIFNEYKLIDVIKNIKMKQSILFKDNIGNYNIKEKFRCYEVEIYLESLNDIKEYFNYNKSDVILILKNQFIPLLSKQISRYLKMGNLKMEISVNNIKDDNIENDEETNTEKYSTKKRKNEEDETGEEEELEDESEQEKTYDDTFIKVNSDDEYDDNEIKDNNLTEDEINTNKTDKKDTDDESNYDNNNYSESEAENNNNRSSKKKNKKDYIKDTLEKKDYIYNDIQIEEMEFENLTDESKFSFKLLLPYVQKNILLKNILEIILKKLNFKNIKNIKKSHILEREKKNGEKEYILQLEGFNFQEISKYSNIIDINRIGTNDIGGILNIYGIEACRSAIVKEIVNVFDVYSIKVDKRHLGLIADYITFQGKYRSFSRKGISYNSSSLLKMSYETTMEFLIDACLGKNIDKCITPSARIFLGRPTLCGTGAFDVIIK